MEAAEPSSAFPAPPRASSAQERPSETKRLFGHREIPQPEEHGPDLCSGHGAPTRTEEIEDVVAVVVSRSSTVRANGKQFTSSSVSFLISLDEDGRSVFDSAEKSFGLYFVLTLKRSYYILGLGCARPVFFITFCITLSKAFNIYICMRTAVIKKKG